LEELRFRRPQRGHDLVSAAIFLRKKKFNGKYFYIDIFHSFAGKYFLNNIFRP